MIDLDSRVREILGFDGASGAVVANVTPGSPAEECGLQQRDVILEYRGKKVRATSQLIADLQRTKVGEDVILKVWREGKELELKAKIGETKLEQMPGGSTTEQGDRLRGPEEILNAIGIEVRDLAVQERLRGFRGVVVTRVIPNALAEPKVQAGDLVVAVNQSPVLSAQEFYRALSASAAVQQTSLHLIRGKQALRVDLAPLPREPAGNGR